MTKDETLPSEWALAHQKSMSEWPMERRERSEQFTKALNLNAMRGAGIELMGSECVSIEKVDEGGMNQIFLLRFSNQAELIARVAIPVDGFTSERVASEVATLQFVRQKTSIPIPKILLSCAGSNAVGAPFTMQERIFGQSLGPIWAGMKAEQQESLLKTLESFEAELWSAQLEGVGSLRREKDSGEFEVGPYIPLSSFWNAEDLERGPWSSAKAYVAGLAERQLRYLENSVSDCLRTHKERWGELSHLDIERLKVYYRLLLRLSSRLDAIHHPSAILHVDLNSDNVMVAIDDPSRIICILDWDYAEVMPLWACWGDWDLLKTYDEDGPAELARTLELRRHREETIAARVPGARAALYEHSHFRMLGSLAYRPPWWHKSADDTRDCITALLRLWPMADAGHGWIKEYISDIGNSTT